MMGSSCSTRNASSQPQSSKIATPSTSIKWQGQSPPTRVVNSSESIAHAEKEEASVLSAQQ